MKKFFIFFVVLFVVAPITAQAGSYSRVPVENYAAANSLSGSITPAKLRAVAEYFLGAVSQRTPEKIRLSHWEAKWVGFELRALTPPAKWSGYNEDPWGEVWVFWDGDVEFHIGNLRKEKGEVFHKQLEDFK